MRNACCLHGLLTASIRKILDKEMIYKYVEILGILTSILDTEMLIILFILVATNVYES